MNNQTIKIGSYKDEEEAFTAYNIVAAKSQSPGVSLPDFKHFIRVISQEM